MSVYKLEKKSQATLNTSSLALATRIGWERDD